MKLSQLLKHCLNYKVLIGIGIVIALFYFFVPQLAQYSWILFALVCPLSMMLMMGSMNHRQNTEKERLYSCPECGLDYKDPEWAKKCAAWCKEHNSCNIDIIQHAVQGNK